MSTMIKGCSLVGIMALVVLIMVMGTRVACPQSQPQSPRVDGAAIPVSLTAASSPQQPQPPPFDVTPRRLFGIEPGTVIGTEPPKGWTHLILKSQPRIGAGDVHKASAIVRRMSSLMFTAVVANVKGEYVNGVPHYYLEKLGVGLGVKVQGQDMIVTPETQQQLGANLDFVARQVLAGGYERLSDVFSVAQSRSFALVDALNYLHVNGRNQPIVTRYAILVDPQTGRIQTLLWRVNRDYQNKYLGAVGPFEWLPPNKIEDCVLYVDGNEITLGIPSEYAFGMNQLPKGAKQIPIPERLQNLAGQPRFTPEQAAQLERELRVLIQ
ncbi:MAG: hypothetical protein ACK4RK_04945 [Gemmataceae bacterium]